MIKQNVPFYENPDDTHCLQASLRMIIEYFLPNSHYDWDQLDEMTGYREGIATWPSLGLVNLRRMGFEIGYKELFDYERFLQEGEDYILEKYGQEMGSWQIDNSDIPQEVENLREFLKHCTPQVGIPTLEEVRHYLQEGYLLLCNVNGMALINEEGYVGHFVVVTGYDDKSFFLHDPGRPGRKALQVSIETFERAWAYPSEEDQGYMALRLVRQENRDPHV